MKCLVSGICLTHRQLHRRRRLVEHAWKYIFEQWSGQKVKMDQSWALFVYFRSFFVTISIIQIERSIDGVLGILTRGHSMVVADETTELWQPPKSLPLLLWSVANVPDREQSTSMWSHLALSSNVDIKTFDQRFHSDQLWNLCQRARLTIDIIFKFKLFQSIVTALLWNNVPWLVKAIVFYFKIHKLLYS